MASTYYIIYPCGDRSKLKVVEICAGLEYELNDYAVAYRDSFYDPMDAHRTAVRLAGLYGKEYIPDTDITGPDYLE